MPMLLGIGDPGTEEFEFASVSAGEEHTCGVQWDGTVVCWGDDDNGKATSPTGEFASVRSGGSHTCGLRTDGTVAWWGEQARGITTQGG